jgi:hypothetical protein
MRRTCFIFCLFMTAASVGLWVRSYFVKDVVGRISSGRYIEAENSRGWTLLTIYAPSRYGLEPVAWYHNTGPSIDYENSLAGSQRSSGHTLTWLFVPLWFPTLTFALLALWLWRRGRRGQKGRGFPVESPLTSDSSQTHAALSPPPRHT